MKIYSSTQPTLADYEGKDVWVKCFRWGTAAYWVRVLDTYYYDNGPVYYTVNIISEMELDQLLHPAKWSTYRIDDPNHLPLETERVGQLPIVEPVQTKTTKELFDLPDTDYVPDDFSRFAGRPVWVKVREFGRNFSDWYIHVQQQRGSTLIYDYIDADYLDDFETCVDHWGPPFEDDGVYGCDAAAHISSFEITQPLEVLTAEEVQDLMEQCDSYWEENHEDEDDEEDEDANSEYFDGDV